MTILIILSTILVCVPTAFFCGYYYSKKINKGIVLIRVTKMENTGEKPMLQVDGHVEVLVMSEDISSVK